MDETENGLSEEAAEAALLETLMGPKPTGEGEEGSDDDTASTDDEGGEYEDFEPNAEDLDDDDAGSEEGGEEGAEDEGDSDEAPAPVALDDSHEVTFTVDGADQKVTLGDLKALYGQREAITRKDAQADLVGAQASAAIETALQVVSEDLQAYANVDWMVLRDQLDPETFAWHRQNAQVLEGKYKKLVGAFQGVEQSFSERRQQVDQDAARAAIQELTADIPDWSDQHYTEILQYGASQGLDAQELATVTNPKVLKIIRKAMLHDKASTVATKKVKAAPAKVIKGAKAAAPGNKQINAKKAMQRLAATGSEDAAVAALMARMG